MRSPPDIFSASFLPVLLLALSLASFPLSAHANSEDPKTPPTTARDPFPRAASPGPVSLPPLNLPASQSLLIPQPPSAAAVAAHSPNMPPPGPPSPLVRQGEMMALQPLGTAAPEARAGLQRQSREKNLNLGGMGGPLSAFHPVGGPAAAAAAAPHSLVSATGGGTFQDTGAHRMAAGPDVHQTHQSFVDALETSRTGSPGGLVSSAAGGGFRRSNARRDIHQEEVGQAHPLSMRSPSSSASSSSNVSPSPAPGLRSGLQRAHGRRNIYVESIRRDRSPGTGSSSGGAHYSEAAPSRGLSRGVGFRQWTDSSSRPGSSSSPGSVGQPHSSSSALLAPQGSPQRSVSPERSPKPQRELSPSSSPGSPPRRLRRLSPRVRV